MQFEQIFGGALSNWHFADNVEELENLNAVHDYRYIFFLHWSEKVPNQLLYEHECVCFHMTDVPYGRGGSPLQNLIERGHRETTLSALRMTEQFDAGPVYLKKALSLKGGPQRRFTCELQSYHSTWPVRFLEHTLYQSNKPEKLLFFVAASLNKAGYQPTLQA